MSPGIKVPSPRQLCGRCRTAVLRHVDATEEPGTRQLFHHRCWRQEQKERRKAERAERRAMERELEQDILEVLTPVAPAAEALDDLRTFVTRGQRAQDAADRVIQARVVHAVPKPPKPPKPFETAPRMPEARAEPAPEPPAPPGEPPGRIIRKGEAWSPTRRHKGIRQLTADWILNHPPGEWWTISQLGEFLSSQGIVTSQGTVQATVSWTLQKLGDRIHRFRDGNMRAYSLTGQLADQEEWGPALNGKPKLPPKAHSPASPKPHSPEPHSPEPHSTEVAKAIDRAMNDLSALVGELIAETRRELRKELGL